MLTLLKKNAKRIKTNVTLLVMKAATYGGACKVEVHKDNRFVKMASGTGLVQVNGLTERRNIPDFLCGCISIQIDEIKTAVSNYCPV